MDQVGLPHLSCEPSSQRRCWLRADDLVSDDAVSEDQEGGDAHDVELAGCLRIFIDVELGNDCPPGEFTR